MGSLRVLHFFFRFDSLFLYILCFSCSEFAVFICRILDAAHHSLPAKHDNGGYFPTRYQFREKSEDIANRA